MKQDYIKTEIVKCLGEIRIIKLLYIFFLKLKMRNKIFYLMYIIKLKLYISCQSISY